MGIPDDQAGDPKKEHIMKFPRKTLAATVFLAAAGISGIASAEMTKMVGGAAHVSEQDHHSERGPLQG